MYLRLAMFLQAISETCDVLELVHFAPPEKPGEPELSDSVFSDFWGAPVRVSRAPLNLGARRMREKIRAPLDVRCRGEFRRYIGAFQSQALTNILSRPADLIFAHRLPAMMSLLQVKSNLPPILFDMDDVDHLVKLRTARSAHSWRARARNMLEIPALLRAETIGVRRAAKTFVCSEHDRQRLSRSGIDVSRVASVANAVAIPPTQPPLVREPAILFIGNYGYPPNAEAAQELVTQIWPLIRAQVPTARLVIAGASPERIAAFATRPAGVEFTGLVGDLAALYAQIRLVCCPIRNGGGTRIKLIEAAGAGKPIVATAVAAEGLALEAGRDFLLCVHAEDIASACVRLLRDDAAARRMANSAYLIASNHYSLADVKTTIVREVRCAAANASPAMAAAYPSCVAATTASPTWETL